MWHVILALVVLPATFAGAAVLIRADRVLGALMVLVAGSLIIGAGNAALMWLG